MPILLAVSPEGFGLLLWPVLAFLSVDLTPRVSKIVLLLLLSAHYLGLALYIGLRWQSDLYWFRIGLNNPGFILFSVASAMMYSLGQIFLWFKFFLTVCSGTHREVNPQ